MESNEPCIVVTQLKDGSKSIHPIFKEGFWLKKNNSANFDIHVKITHFKSYPEAEAFAAKRSADFTPVDSDGLKKVEAKIKEKAEADAQKKAQEQIDKAAKANDEKLKKLQDKLDKLEADKQKK